MDAEGARLAFFGLHCCQFQRTFLNTHVLAGVYQPLLERAYIDVSGHHFGDQADEDRIIVTNRRVEVGIRCFDGPAD